MIGSWKLMKLMGSKELCLRMDRDRRVSLVLHVGTEARLHLCPAHT